MNSIPKLLSKTKLMRGYRCLKSIYLTIHQPTLEAPITPETQALFDQGNKVGAKAREYYSGGVLIDNLPWDFIGALAKTRELLTNNTEIIYEAAFEYMGCYARVDIIQYSRETKRWRIYEVKSTTKVKPEHYDDVGLQTWIMVKSGLPIEKISIIHLNPECRFPDLSNLFKEVDVTQEIREKYLSIKPKISEIFSTIRIPEVPSTNIGPHCHAPTECGFVQHCWQQKNIPQISIFDLPGLRDKKWELFENDITRLDDIRLTDLNDLQARIIHCFKTGERFIHKELIKAELTKWQFPLVFLDFETINPAIPRYQGSRPFGQVPFQFSVHIWNSDGIITHHEFLHDNADDPRPLLIPELIKACGEHGSIVAYYGKFEAERIEELANYSAEYRDALLNLKTRIVDPLPIIREAVYDNAFAGSFSLKKVAPALLGESHSYDGMMIANGNDAQRGFEELISTSILSHKKIKLKQAMLDYCKKDTYVMVELVKWLYKQIEEKNDENNHTISTLVNDVSSVCTNNAISSRNQD